MAKFSEKLKMTPPPLPREFGMRVDFNSAFYKYGFRDALLQ